MLTTQLQANVPSLDPAVIPPIFCWTKMGTEAGQPLETILRRKELERKAGGGIFSWGIGSSLGEAPALARQAFPNEGIDVLFTPMKSAPKAADVSPSQLLLWLGYLDGPEATKELPLHMVITSRGGPFGSMKRTHYALVCNGGQDISIPSEPAFIDANKTRNFVSHNPLGASQVTAMVRYQANCHTLQEKLYRVAFRARMYGAGFIRLASPVLLEGRLLTLYRELCSSTSPTEWLEGARHLRHEVHMSKNHRSIQPLSFEGVFA